MTTLTRQKLADDVANLASVYLGKGTRIPAVETVSPEDRIRDIEELLLRYFILTGIEQTDTQVDPSAEQTAPDVIPFVRKLPGRIRRIKITTEPRIENQRGRIEGQIDWQETTKVRARRAPGDQQLFAVRLTDEQVETQENRVLATLIDRIYRILQGRLEEARESPNQYQWLSAWAGADAPLWTTIQRLKFDNPYLSEIEISENPVPGAILEEVKQARSPIYREAAKLLERYQRYEQGVYEQDELQELFNQLFVGPDSLYELFELYWAYKLMQQFEERYLIPITDSANEIARWETETFEYRLFTDATDSENTKFYVPLRSAEAERNVLDARFPDQDTYTQRYVTAIDRAGSLKTEILDMEGVQRSLYSGRPDLLLTKSNTQSGVLQEVFVGEVKYPESAHWRKQRSKAAEGIEQCIEYIEMIRDDAGEYLSKHGDSRKVKGAVFVPELDYDISSTSDNQIQVIQYDDEMTQPI